MSIQTEISRISTLRNSIRTKLIALGIISSPTADLNACTTAIQSIVKVGGVDASVKEGETYTVPAGYHDGTGTVHGIAGGGSYNLQPKTVTPTTEQQAITPDEGYYGISDVTVGAIPSNYADVSNVTAAAGDVLAGKVIVNASGQEVTGGIANNGTLAETMDGLTKTTVTLTAGYYAGGSVSLTDDIEEALAAI